MRYIYLLTYPLYTGRYPELKTETLRSRGCSIGIDGGGVVFEPLGSSYMEVARVTATRGRDKYSLTPYQLPC